MKRLRDIFFKNKCKPLAEAQGLLASRYRAFKTLLSHNQSALTSLADLEQLYYRGKPFSLNEVRIRYEALLESVLGIVHSLEVLSGKSFPGLSERADRIDAELFTNFNPRCMTAAGIPVLAFADITRDMSTLVGAKAANLASIANDLALPVPPAFAVTASAFESFLQENKLLRSIQEELSFLSSADPTALEKASSRIRTTILEAKVPPAVSDAILKAYSALEKKSGKGVRIALRSSAVGEDSLATFAGQYETVLNVTEENILGAYKQVLASKYSARAIAYRIHHGLDDREAPMCVIGIIMIDAASSGVLYSVDPSSVQNRQVKVNSIWGIGEYLVDGSASPDVFVIDRDSRSIVERHITGKRVRLSNIATGGTALEPVPVDQQHRPSLDDANVLQLAGYGLLLEEFFGGPQDVEWVVDPKGHLFILQSRPLYLSDFSSGQELRREYADNLLLLSGGITASNGTASGRVFILKQGQAVGSVPDDAILVTRTASPDLATVIGRIKGIITDVGSVTSHMASVAREFGIPALVDTGNATSLLAGGELVTLAANRATVYRGVVQELAAEMRPAKKLIFDSPIHQRMRTILDRISPLHLTDPSSPAFAPDGCTTFHDIIRYTHEVAVLEMFGLSGSPEPGVSARLASSLPLRLAIIDLGGGLKKGLTTCDTVTPDHFESVPLKAVWTGFSHPGVNWAGTMSIDTETLSGVLAVTATAEFGPAPGGESYALISKDYLNLSIRFAYHFATLDALCGRISGQNYVRLQFSGGAGNYYGRSLRVQFMGSVLERLGFEVSIKGDLLEAFIGRYDQRSLEEKLNLLGRLLASSRLLDMHLSDQDQIERFAEAFSRGDYDLLMERENDALRSFYLQGGSWQREQEEGRFLLKQDGSRWGRRVASEVTGLIDKVIGRSYRDFLDTIEAYSYFPLAIARDIELSAGSICVRVRPIGGKVDQAGGLIFGMRNRDNYFVLRTNALEGNIILFEYINGKRIERWSMRTSIATGQWHTLSVQIAGNRVRGYLDGEPVVEHSAEFELKGFVGLWTKADSVVSFDRLTIEDETGRRTIAF